MFFTLRGAMQLDVDDFRLTIVDTSKERYASWCVFIPVAEKPKLGSRNNGFKLFSSSLNIACLNEANIYLRLSATYLMST